MTKDIFMNKKMPSVANICNIFAICIFAMQQWRPYWLGLYAVLKPSVL
jgi:hypothetical protein